MREKYTKQEVIKKLKEAGYSDLVKYDEETGKATYFCLNTFIDELLE